MISDPHPERTPSGWSSLSNRVRLRVAVRLGFAALTFAAIATQLVDQVDNDRSLINFFSFFTIQSNVIIMVVFFVGAVLDLKGREPASWQLVRGAAASFMITTGVVYGLLLSGLEEDLQTAIPWVNGVLHYWMPLVALLDWIIERPSGPIAFRAALVWLVFPLSWLAYTLIRGAAIDWFPYPFLDPDHNDQGVLQVAVTTAVIFLAFVGLVWLMARKSGLRLRPA